MGEAVTQTGSLGGGVQGGRQCRRVPEEAVVLGDLFVCLFNYLLGCI